MRPHMRFYFVFADNDVFSDPSWKPLVPLGGGRRPDRPFNLRCQICHAQPEPGWKLVRSAIAGGMLSLRRNGGVRRDRTDDLMLAKHALYQLSYDPPFRKAGCSWEHPRLRGWSSTCLSARGSHEVWWAQADSNRRPHAYQACALTS
jgi:hypothetical protein